MTTRRNFIKTMAVIAGGVLLQPHRTSAMTPDDKVWFMSDEGDPHKRTWMAFGASKKVWGGKLFPEVQRNLATIALTIAKYEPVSMLVREEAQGWVKSCNITSWPHIPLRPSVPVGCFSLCGSLYFGARR